MATDWEETCVGVQERTLDTGFHHIRVHYSADPEKNDDWRRWKSAQYGGVDDPRWRREFEIDYNATQGQPVYPMLSAAHIAERLISDWAVYRVIDHGIRHPTVCLWIAVNKSGDRHVFREYYSTGKTIEFNCQEISRRSDETVIATYIDPATKQRIPMGGKDNKPVSVVSQYNRALESACRFADNSAAGYDAVRAGLLAQLARKALREGELNQDDFLAKEYFQKFLISDAELLAMSNRPSLTIASSCPRVFRELRNLRFKEITGDETTKAPPEEIMDFEDDGPDCVRYGMQSKLTWKKRQVVQKGSILWQIQQKRLRQSNPRKRYGR